MNFLIRQLITKRLVESDDFKYVYDDKDTRHGTERINSFYASVRSELKNKHNIIQTDNELKKIWANMRRRFVNFNLKKARQEAISESQNEFYNSLIFLEDFIKHKNCDTYKTINRKEIIDQQYNKIMGFTTEGEEDNLFPAEKSSDDDEFPDISQIFTLNNHDNHETESNNYDDKENVEFLDKDEEVVMEYLKKQSNMGENIQNNNEAANVKHANLVIPLHEKNNAAESMISLIRSKNENNSLINKSKICNEITKLLNFIVTEVQNPIKRSSILQFILQCIEDFCETRVVM